MGSGGKVASLASPLNCHWINLPGFLDMSSEVHILRLACCTRPVQQTAFWVHPDAI
jgi:hypothetical protein